MIDESKANILFSRRLPSGLRNSIRSKVHDAVFSQRKNVLKSLARRDVREDGTLRPKPFFEAMADAGVELNEDEMILILKRFANHRLEVDYQRFYTTLDIDVPKDFSEPELFFDPLPQPYRMISKLLDLEIVDRAWNTICRSHPELLVNEEGKQRHVRPNQNLEQLVTPSMALDTAHAVTCATYDRSGRYIFMGTATGFLLVVDEKEGRSLAVVSAFEGTADNSSCGISMITDVSESQDRRLPLRLALVCATPPAPPKELTEEEKAAQEAATAAATGNKKGGKKGSVSAKNVPAPDAEEDEEAGRAAQLANPPPSGADDKTVIRVMEVTFSSSSTADAVVRAICHVEVQGLVEHVALSGDGMYLSATKASDGTTLLFDLPRLEPFPDSLLRALQGETSRAASVNGRGSGGGATSATRMQGIAEDQQMRVDEHIASFVVHIRNPSFVVPPLFDRDQLLPENARKRKSGKRTRATVDEEWAVPNLPYNRGRTAVLFTAVPQLADTQAARRAQQAQERLDAAAAAGDGGGAAAATALLAAQVSVRLASSSDEEKDGDGPPRKTDAEIVADFRAQSSTRWCTGVVVACPDINLIRHYQLPARGSERWAGWSLAKIAEEEQGADLESVGSVDADEEKDAIAAGDVDDMSSQGGGGGAAGHRRVIMLDAPSDDDATRHSNTPALQAEWMLPARPSVCEVDNSLTMLGVGLADGAVLLYDMCTPMLRGVIGQHPAPVTSLSFYKNEYLLSGCTDGMLAVFALSPRMCKTQEEQREQWASASASASAVPPTAPGTVSAMTGTLGMMSSSVGGTGGGGQVRRAEGLSLRREDLFHAAAEQEAMQLADAGVEMPSLLGFRADFGEPISRIQCVGHVPLAFVQSSSGVVAAMDIPTHELLGRTVFYRKEASSIAGAPQCFPLHVKYQFWSALHSDRHAAVSAVERGQVLLAERRRKERKRRGLPEEDPAADASADGAVAGQEEDGSGMHSAATSRASTAEGTVAPVTYANLTAETALYAPTPPSSTTTGADAGHPAPDVLLAQRSQACLRCGTNSMAVLYVVDSSILDGSAATGSGTGGTGGDDISLASASLASASMGDREDGERSLAGDIEGDGGSVEGKSPDRGMGHGLHEAVGPRLLTRLAVFHVEDVLLELCPGLKALVGGEIDPAMLVDAYRRLSVKERSDPNLTLNKVSCPLPSRSTPNLPGTGNSSRLGTGAGARDNSSRALKRRPSGVSLAMSGPVPMTGRSASGASMGSRGTGTGVGATAGGGPGGRQVTVATLTADNLASLKGGDAMMPPLLTSRAPHATDATQPMRYMDPSEVQRATKAERQRDIRRGKRIANRQQLMMTCL